LQIEGYFHPGLAVWSMPVDVSLLLRIRQASARQREDLKDGHVGAVRNGIGTRLENLSQNREDLASVRPNRKGDLRINEVAVPVTLTKQFGRLAVHRRAVIALPVP
jgi:hypothetical protein